MTLNATTANFNCLIPTIKALEKGAVHKKGCFPLRISLVNVTKSAGN